ncbi:hypothetical protein [Acidovorax sp. sic0104]|uniref:hypothetical protein n=1 Tax=Acidovorax sp. sic0104 TaxID=2854784 RepID=UPI001C4725E6|nr:hypothetical protein [Acidovorax sp. sic0104]MBV7540322.1 hypothetical protein [Acidovorax sp. sic0104]
MYLIVIVWTYVTLMMAVAEATSPVGTVLGAIITFVLYGVLPMGILVYILGTPSRKHKIKAREAAEQAEYDAQQAPENVRPSDEGIVSGDNEAPPLASVAPDAGGEAPGAAEHATVAPVRKEP